MICHILYSLLWLAGFLNATGGWPLMKTMERYSCLGDFLFSHGLQRFMDPTPNPNKFLLSDVMSLAVKRDQGYHLPPVYGTILQPHQNEIASPSIHHSG